MNCHTVDGYRSMRKLLHGRDRHSIDNLLQMLHDQPKDSPYRTYMPPLVGTPQEIQSLAGFLNYLENGNARGPVVAKNTP